MLAPRSLPVARFLPGVSDSPGMEKDRDIGSISGRAVGTGSTFSNRSNKVNLKKNKTGDLCTRQTRGSFCRHAEDFPQRTGSSWFSFLIQNTSVGN